MRLTSLSLRRFRNLGVQDLEIPHEGVALVGDNAQGKSSFLEAIYYLETFRSFRGARDEQLVAFGEDVFRIGGTVQSGGEVGSSVSEITAAFARDGKRKKVTVDGVEPDRLGDAIGGLAAVIFSPADIELVGGGPAERRRFLDILLSLNEPGYLSALQEYRRVLARRNASLKGRAPRSVVTAWNDGLVRSGARVVAARVAWVEASSAPFDECYATISGEAGANMTYSSSVKLEGARSVSDIEAAFRTALERSADREHRKAVTVVGPHRDDVRLRLAGDGEGLSLRSYGSGGQRRTAALALRLVEARTIQERRGTEPLMLFDDVFAELDTGRSERVLELMDSTRVGQVVLTAPKASDVRVRAEVLPRWHVEGGRIET
ncbi:MAG: DNA replication and repair protein RecF [Gemmatimonadota bacterium]|nr:DNA replication and repair protein RecF [Gemmatimonadota bacterium]